MKIHHVLLVTLLASTAHAADTKTGSGDAAATFERLKSLVGEWESQTDKGRITYELTGGGTALLEKYSSERRVTMHTLYHLVGDRLLLTHYCMAGNRPRMVAGPLDPKTGVLEFKFLDATNLAKPTAGHMHDVKMRLIDQNHFEAEWR